MNAERLLASFSKIGDSPEHMQQLRRIAVALAVSGRFDDEATVIEPAELLESIEKLKRDMTRQGRLPKQKKYAEVTEHHLPKGFSNPTRFARLGDIARIEKGQTGIKQVRSGSFPLVVTASERIACDHYDFDGAAAIVPLVSSTGHGKASLHRLHYQEGQFALGTILAAVFPHDPSVISARFLFEYLSAFKEELLVSRMIGTANVSLSVGKIAEVPVPLVCPEVQRKVDTLMVLCDRLETARAERETRRDQLVEASLHRLTVANDGSIGDATCLAEHVRFVLQHFARLTSRPEHIKQLRQKILSLAIRGRLVAQDPADEPAIELLTKIAEKRRAFLEAGLPNITEASAQQRKQERQSIPEGLDVLPSGWHWATLLQCSELVVDCHNKTAPYSKSGIVLLRTTNVRDGRVNLNEPKFVDEKTYERWSARCQPQPGDILITREAPMGEVAIIPDGMMVCLGQRMMLARLVRDLIDPSFMLYSLRDPDLMNRVQDKPVGATVQHLRVGGVETLLVPLPPLAEQRRIVAKLDELMALCDQLEASFATVQIDRSRLLDAMLHEALQPASIRKDGRIRDKWRARSAISSYVVSRLSSKRSFGRTAHMKHLYLAEAHLGLELDGAYAREAAGPLDARIYDLEKHATSSGWYSPRVEVLTSGQEKVTYSSGKNMEQIVEEGASLLGSSRAELDRLLGLMGDMSTEQVEIIATLFAAWNDALIDARLPDDDWIVEEVREHWHKSKQRFTPAELKKWLGWMRANDLVPAGRLPRTIQQTTLDF